MMDYQPLRQAIDGATRPVYPSSFAEVSQHFKERFSSDKWRGEMAAQMSGVHSGKEYLAARRQVERWEQKGNFEKAKPASKAVVETVGKTLEPIRRDVPAKGLTFEVRFNAPEDKGHAQRTRTATIQMSSMEAYQFVNDPSYADLFDYWFDDGGDTYGDDGDYEAEILSVSAA